MLNLKRIKELKSQMSSEQKKRLLVGLKKLKEEYTGNVGGETDIANADNLGVNENEYTSGNTQEEPKIIAKTFDTKADFDSYVNQHRGIEITPKEQQAILTEAEDIQMDAQSQTPDEQEVIADDKIRITKTITFIDETEGADILADFLEELELHNQRPVEQDKFHLKYEFTDSFGINSTVVIKKQKENGQFCWVAYAKHERAEEEGKPNEPEGEI